MAMDFLRQLAGSELPSDFISPDDIDKIRVLHAAGLVVAVTPAEGAPLAGLPAHAARVIDITERGREELRREFGQDDRPQGSASTADLLERLRGMVTRARSSRRE